MSQTQNPKQSLYIHILRPIRFVIPLLHAHRKFEFRTFCQLHDFIQRMQLTVEKCELYAYVLGIVDKIERVVSSLELNVILWFPALTGRMR